MPARTDVLWALAVGPVASTESPQHSAARADASLVIFAAVSGFVFGPATRMGSPGLPHTWRVCLARGRGIAPTCKELLDTRRVLYC